MRSEGEDRLGLDPSYWRVIFIHNFFTKEFESVQLGFLVWTEVCSPSLKDKHDI